jgi:ubiquinone/menaquinone biosynthesis C-methylase UbiE
MDENTKGQVSQNAAEVYEEYFVPALFQEWPERVLDAASLKAGERFLDVACGSGVLARYAVERVGVSGKVTGLDVNDGMLSVARRIAPAIEWESGRAEDLPFPDDSFDAIGCQFGLMFFDDRVGAIRDMMRVLSPGGRMAAAVWDSLDHSPGFLVLANLLQTFFGETAAKSLQAPFCLGDRQTLRAIFVEAGIQDAQIETHTGIARFRSMDDWLYTNIKGWTLAESIDDAQYYRLLQEAQIAFKPFLTSDGAIVFPSPAHIVRVVKE